MTANKYPKALRKAWFLFAVFLLPAIVCILFYYFFIRQPLIIEAKASLYKTLPYYGSKLITDKGDTTYNQVKEIALINTKGEPISTEQYAKKVLVINFFSLQNQGNSDKMAASLFRVQNKLEYLKNFIILSVNLTSKSDSLFLIKETEKKVHTHERIWNFYSGNQDEIQRWARVSFGVRKGEIDSLSVNKLYLVDLNRNIRGVYDGTQTAEVNRLLDEVKVLNAIYRIK